MAVNFPSSPFVGQIYTYNGRSWEWNGTYWESYSFPSSGLTGATSVGVGDSVISGIVDNILELKSFSGDGITITDDGNTLTFSASTGGTVTSVSGGTGLSGNSTTGAVVLINTAPDQTVTITGGTNIQISGTYPNFGVDYTGQTSFPYLPLSGGTVTGETIFQSGLTATTISAITYQNIPTFSGGSITGLTINGNLTVTGNTSLQGLTATTISATTYYNLPFSGTVNGNGTTNYLPKWTGSTGIGDSTIYDDGSFVGINITSPTYNESVSIQTGNKGILIDDAYVIQTGNGSLAFAARYDYTSWGGTNEIAIGSRGPLSNSTGSGNIGIGDKALLQNTTGNNNIGIGGTQALGNNIGGNSNIGIGNESLLINSEGSQNIAIGESSLRNNTSGSTNIAIGTSAGYSNLNDNGNVYIGDSAGYSNIGGNNIFIGYGAGSADTSSNNILNIGDTIFGSLSGKTIGINVTAQTNTLHVSASTNPVRFEGLQSSTDTRYLVSDGNGVVTYRNLPGSSASDCFGTFYTSAISGCSPVTILTPLNATEGLNVTGTTIIQSLSATSFSASTYQGNVVTQITAGSGISVDQSTGNVTISSTGGGGTFTGGTVTGSTNFTGGLSSNTISATTYQNLPTTNQYIVVAGTGSPMVPSSGQLILNPSEGEVFEIYISKTTYDGINNSSVIEGIKNSILVFNNSLFYSIYTLSFVSDFATYVRFGATLTGGDDYFTTNGQIVGATFISFGTVNTLTTVGTSGAATLVGSTLNIPQYGGGGGLTFQQVQMVAFLSS